jgi:hypothetical protein
MKSGDKVTRVETCQQKWLVLSDSTEIRFDCLEEVLALEDSFSTNLTLTSRPRVVLPSQTLFRCRSSALEDLDMYTIRLQAHRNLQYTNARQRRILSHVPFAPAAAQQVYKTVGAAETQAGDSEIEAEVSLSNKMKVSHRSTVSTSSCVYVMIDPLQEVFDRLPFRRTLVHINRGTWSIQRSNNTIQLHGNVRYTRISYFSTRVTARNLV